MARTSSGTGQHPCPAYSAGAHPDRIHEGGDDQLRRCLRDVTVQTLDGLTLAGLRAVDTAVLMQSRAHLFEFKAISGTHRLDVVCQQAELGRSVVWMPRM